MLETPWPDFLSPSQRYVVRGTSCAHFKRSPLGDSRLTNATVPAQSHPINHYCCGIIVKQAKSLLSAPTHEGEEDGRPEEWLKACILQLNQYLYNYSLLNWHLICVYWVPYGWWRYKKKKKKEFSLTHAAISDQLLQATAVKAVKAAGWLGVFVWEQR